MEWNRQLALPLAEAACKFCKGVGLESGNEQSTVPCACVLTAVFTQVMDRFEKITNQAGAISIAQLGTTSSKSPKRSWSLPHNDFCCDVLVIAKRALTRAEHQVFRVAVLLGADWQLCCRRWGWEKARYFREVANIRQKLGHAFAETRPYPLYPLDEYFNGAALDHQAERQKLLTPIVVPPRQRGGARPSVVSPIAA